MKKNFSLSWSGDAEINSNNRLIRSTYRRQQVAKSSLTIGDVQLVLEFRELVLENSGVVDPPVQLPEVGQSRRSHPDNLEEQPRVLLAAGHSEQNN